MELTVDQALQQGVAAHKEGKVQEAEKLYRAILSGQPQHPDANHNLGILGMNIGRLEGSLPFFRKALESDPVVDQFWISYIGALLDLGRVDEARGVFSKATIEPLVVTSNLDSVCPSFAEKVEDGFSY